jgi:murein DD-endopeptidase MepM/ murein hydrolase activator NlpD
MIFRNPLEKMKLTQPFGVDWTGEDMYAKLGMKGHNGWDLSCMTGTNIYAVMDGEMVYTEEPNGYGNDIRIINKISGLEVVYGHLKCALVPNGIVAAGDLIATSDNTGLSTGPHLHIGVRKLKFTESGSQVLNYFNGYFGYLDPTEFFAPDVFALPVDRRYGLPEDARGYSDLEWYKVAAWIWSVRKRLPSTQEKNALVWGRWDWRTVNDPAMFPLWSEMTKMKYLKSKQQ